jgi:tetratricopeptide (TPR) repeat protein
VPDRLRPLWDFADLDGSERRLREALARESTPAGRAEILTQLARVEGLRGDFEAVERLVEEAESVAAGELLPRVRIDLERGRLYRSSGDRERALPLFESAYALALEAEEGFLAGDAAHMAALAAPGREAYVAWTERGIALAESREDARYWLGPLLNNLGWEHYEAGEHEKALSAFERALAAREDDPGSPEPIALARYAVGKALRALGRSQEAVAHVEQAVAWARDEGAPDGWYHEELALEYAELGRSGAAAEQARLALPLLEEADPSFADDAERRSRLRALAGVHPT